MSKRGPAGATNSGSLAEGPAYRLEDAPMLRTVVGTTRSSVYWPRDCGSTPAKVRKSVIRNVPLLAGNVGRQRGCVVR